MYSKIFVFFYYWIFDLPLIILLYLIFRSIKSSKNQQLYFKITMKLSSWSRNINSSTDYFSGGKGPHCVLNHCWIYRTYVCTYLKFRTHRLVPSDPSLVPYVLWSLKWSPSKRWLTKSWRACFDGHLILIIIDAFLYAFLADLYLNIWCSFFKNLVCYSYK